MTVKTAFESLFTPFAKRLPLSPNTLTIVAVIVMAVASWQVMQNNFILAALLVLLSGFIDMLDGTVAKSQNRATSFGALLDRVGDRASDALIFGAIILAGLVQLWLGLTVLVLVLLGSYTSACLEAATKTKVGEKLSMRAVRLLLLVAFMLLASMVDSSPLQSNGSLVYGFSYFDCVFLIIGLLTLYAFFQRLYVSFKTLSAQRQSAAL